ncbi:MAG TPA: hypothetical protein VMY43_03515 [Methanothrix sp.]|nr:hypothetical protein [Methanothrix sp.]
MKGVPILIIFTLLSICSAFDLSPAHPSPGDKITLTGTASPSEEVSLRSSFTMNLPVAAGQYEYETSVEIPQKPNRFKVTARNVQDFNAGVKLGIWITKSFPASSGTASISQSDVPPGRYSLKMFGEAQPGSTVVPVEVVAETKIAADSSGKYTLDIDTSGIPAGDYRIEGAGDSKTIHLGGAGLVSTSTSSNGNGWSGDGDDNNNKASSAKQAAKPVPINRETVSWYAQQTGLTIENSSQYDEAEKLLKKRLSGGYWKIIARGDPLTEEAGDCLQEYCLVRGVDACTICREKDIILNGNQSSKYSDRNELRPSSSPKNQSQQTAEPMEEKGLLSRFTDWISGLLGMH